MSDDVTLPVYLDWAATTPLRPCACEAMRPLLQEGIAGLMAGGGNANSLYRVGRTAFKALEGAREDLARLIGARPNEIIFTSGATEADNAALFGMVDALMMQAEHAGDHDCVPNVVVSSIEHDAVLSAARVLNGWGADVTVVEPDRNGFITPEALADAMNEHTILVSVMAVNNEIGSVMDIPALAKVVRSKGNHGKGALFHVDATQALGKVPLSVRDWMVDALSLSSHKVGGPKGVGALYLRTRTPFSAQMVGGGQESGHRSGTQNVAGVVGFVAAAKQAVAEQASEAKRLMLLRDRCYEGLCACEGVEATVSCAAGSKDYSPHVVNVTVAGVESETLILRLDNAGFCVSGGSACASHSLDPSHVLKALGISRDRALTSMRVSFGWETTEADVEAFIACFREIFGE
ncbi:MAG: cysteine desulfurase family protein [Coriobacteriia bacterium]|nr:cysteine desulfurase family protein [Coriobacteriia bacterium]